MLDLPCTHGQLLHEVVDVALRLLPSPMTSDPARVEVVAIAGQESNLETRLQKPNGPAHSLWQFERGGIHGVLTHPLTAKHAAGLCSTLGVSPTEDAVYEAMLTNDVLGAGFARLNLWWKPEPIPTTEDEAFAYYDSIWRPGKPDPSRWTRHYQAAVAAVTGT